MNLPLLLTDERLSGPVGVRRFVRPARHVHLVDNDSLSDAAELVAQLSDTWGGAYHVMIPVKRGSGSIPEPWLTLLRDSRPAVTATRGILPSPKPGAWPSYGGVWTDSTGAMSPLEVLARAQNPLNLTVLTANGVDPSDPWYVSYLGQLGTVPAPEDVVLGPLSRLIPGTSYDDLLTVDRSAPSALSAEALLEAVRRNGHCTAVDISCFDVPLWHAAVNTSIGGDDPLIPLRFHKARQDGPNLVIVYEPGSVPDLCLLWHLRAVHGLPPGLPMAIPDGPHVASTLDFLAMNETLGSWGFRPTRGHLISASLDQERLAEIASATRTGAWAAASWEDELQPSSGCGSGSIEVLVFDEGTASTSALATDERETFRAALSSREVRLELEVHPVDRPLPPSDSLGDRLSRKYGAGQVIEVSDRREVVRIDWPSGLAVLRAVVRDRGLWAAPSQPGRIAEAALRRLDSAGGVAPLMHSASLDLLTELGRRHGMNWFKTTLRTVLSGEEAPASQALAERIAQIEERVEEMASAPSPEEQSDITFSSVQQALKDRNGAEHWLAWADRAGLVLRGTQTQCHRCNHRMWRPLNDLAPPMTCAGCGSTIDRPYGYNDLKFRYRASELLLQIMKVDALAHVLTFNFFTRLFAPSSGRVGAIYGGYPGIEFFADASRDAPIGEADVVFVLADGGLAIGECKARSGGLTALELDKLWRLGESLGAAFTFVATLDRASNCGPLWQKTPASDAIPHYSLTAEHLHTLHPTHPLGQNPLAWRTEFVEFGMSAQSDREHDQGVLRTLAEIDAWERRGRVPWWQMPPEEADPA